MTTNGNNLLTCYNKGCCQKFDPDNNPEGKFANFRLGFLTCNFYNSSPDACRYHPGVPFFHDAYKGWTCCNKKSADFTEFLNYPGCTFGKHSNVKPEEPVKPAPAQTLPDEVIEVKPVTAPQIKRPPFDSPMTILKPILTPSVKQLINSNQNNTTEMKDESDNRINIGAPCQNSGCKVLYEGETTELTECAYHPGCPIFHEGMKYWSCCQKKTSDFQTFLNQAGCARGTHLWHKKVNM